MQEIEIKQLRYFVEVATTLNVTKAADNLNVVKSVVSKSLTQLEKQVGGKLLDRTTRNIRLTETGEFLLQRAQNLLQEFRHLTEDMSSISTEVRGVLKLTAAPALGYYLTKHLIPIFSSQWPDIRVSLELSYDYENLFSKGLDLAFRFSQIKDDRLITRTIGNSRRVLVASNQYLSKADLIRNIDDVSKHRCLLFQTHEEFSSWGLDNGQESKSLSVTGPFQCSNIEVLKEATLNGMGIGFIPLFAIQEELKEKRLVRVLPEWSRKTQILAAYRTGSHQSPKLAAFLKCISENTHLFNID